MSGIDCKILILFAHPTQRRSEVNVPMIKVAEWMPGVTVVDLYAEYPNYDIDVDREQTRLRDHDAVIFAFPLYWYSTPAILKEWQDLVLEYGFAYGEGGKALHGKLFLAACTTGGPEEAYTLAGYNHFSLRELLRPLEQTATLCGMTYLAPFVLHSARSAKERGRISEHLDQWENLLEALAHGQLEIEAARRAPVLNGIVRQLIEGH